MARSTFVNQANCVSSEPVISGYVIQQRIGNGARQEVFLAEQQSLQRVVALKILQPEFARDPVARAQLVGEGKAAARLTHPNLLAVFDIGEVDGRPYIATEYLQRGSLRECFAEIKTEPQRIRIARDLTLGLRHLHLSGFVHRDIKPTKVYLRDDGSAVLADTGVTRRERASGGDDMTFGSPFYMSPEQARGEPTDHRSDFYSLGVLLYELISGQTPFDGDDAFDLALKHVNEPPPPLPASASAWEPLIQKLLVKYPADRPADADALLLALDRLNAQFQTLSRPAPAPAATVVQKPVPRAPDPGFERTIVAAPMPLSSAPTTAGTPLPPPRPGVAPQSKRLWLILAVLALLIVAAASAFWLWRKVKFAEPADASASTTQAAPVETVGEIETVDALLRQAARLREPEESLGQNDIAITKYLEVLQLEPRNAQATQALRELELIAAKQIDEAASLGKLSTQSSLLEQAVRYFPENESFKKQRAAIENRAQR